MPKTKQTPTTLEKWKSRIKRGIKYQEEFGKSKLWTHYYKCYYGDYPDSIYVVNKIFSHLRSMVPRIYPRNPKVLVSAKRPEFRARARVLQTVDNYLIRELEMKQTVKAIAQDAFFCNRGIAKVGYSREYGEVPNTAKRSLPDIEKIEYNVTVKEGMPWVLRVNPLNFTVPWGTDGYLGLKSTWWSAHKIIRSLDDIKKDPNYENTAGLYGGPVREVRGRKEGDLVSGSTIKSSQTMDMGGSEDIEWVEMWEIRDAKNQKILTINLNHDKYLRSPENDNLQIEGIPFVDVCFNPDNDVYWGPSDMTQLEPLQQELNEIKTQSSEHRRINLIKFLFDLDKVSYTQVKALFDGNVGTFLGIPGLTRETFVPLQPGEPISLRQDSAEVEKDIRSTLGFDRTQEGDFPGSPRRTAKEIQAVQQGHWIRVDERRDALADFLISSIRKINQIIFREWTSSRIAPVVGPDRAVHWVQYTGADLAGEYDFEIDIDTGRPVTTEVKRAEAEKLWAMFQGRADLIDEAALAKDVLRLYDWIDTDKVAMPSAGQGGAPQIEGMEQFAEMFQGGGV